VSGLDKLGNFKDLKIEARYSLEGVSESDPPMESFDVFLCHNSEDKPVVREISRKLVENNIRPWLDEDEIRPGTSWQTALGRQIESIKSAAVFVGASGIGPWQNQEIQALLGNS
jgi:TIR domain